MIDLSSLAQYLKKSRKAAGLSLNDVYRETGITTSRLSRLESQRTPDPPIETLCALAQLYGVSVDEVLYEAGLIEKVPPHAFKHSELLLEEEIETVQQVINSLVKERI